MSSVTITNVQGPAIPVRGNDIDTDRIIPARYLRCVTFDGLGEHAFEDDRKQDPSHSFNQPQFQNAKVLLVDRNFGCGSSREHAPQSLQKWGIEAVIGQSFAEIFFGNCVAMGIPCLRVDDQTVDALVALVENNPDLEIAIDVTTATITAGESTFSGELPAGAQRALVEGTWNATAVLLEAGDAIDQTAQNLPYTNNFGS